MRFNQSRLLTGSLVVALCCWLYACSAESGGEQSISEESSDLSLLLAAAVGVCDPYEQSSLYRPRQNSQIVNPQSDWISSIERAAPDTEILLEDGNYQLDQYVVQVRSGVTVRSLSGDPSSVRIQGMGYDVPSEGIMIVGNDVTIADISISDFRDHGVVMNPTIGGQQGLQLYNLDIKDIGTQHVKVNPPGARDGLIACSSIGYSDGAALGDYNGAIDMHATIDWTIRDNYIYNINGDGSGCLLDRDCGQYISAPAILVWNGAEGTEVIGNTIFDSFRNIAFGLGTSHVGGSISHNTIYQATPGDAGIELYGASDTIVEFNTVKLAGDYPGTIEFRQSDNITITNNWLSVPPWDRGGNQNISLSENNTRVSESPALELF